MDSALALAVQVVLDVLAERAAADGTAFRITTVDCGEQRTALAKRFAQFVPPGTSVDDVERVAAGIAPFLATMRHA